VCGAAVPAEGSQLHVQLKHALNKHCSAAALLQRLVLLDYCKVHGENAPATKRYTLVMCGAAVPVEGSQPHEQLHLLSTSTAAPQHSSNDWCCWTTCCQVRGREASKT
jgi:hypothetical protein